MEVNSTTSFAIIGHHNNRAFILCLAREWSRDASIPPMIRKPRDGRRYTGKTAVRRSINTKLISYVYTSRNGRGTGPAREPPLSGTRQHDRGRETCQIYAIGRKTLGGQCVVASRAASPLSVTFSWQHQRASSCAPRVPRHRRRSGTGLRRPPPGTWPKGAWTRI